MPSYRFSVALSARRDLTTGRFSPSTPITELHRQKLPPSGPRQITAGFGRRLQYPKFQLDAAEREALLADYLPYAETFTTGDEPSPAGLRDPADAMFIALAQQARADVLVSGDEDILTLRETLSVPVMAPARFLTWLDSG